MTNVPTRDDILGFIAIRAALLAAYVSTSALTPEVKAAERAYGLAVEKLLLSFPCPVSHCEGTPGAHCGAAGTSKRKTIVMWSVDHDIRVHGSRIRAAETVIRSIDKRAGVLL